MAKFEENPVGHYTGTLSYSVPLYVVRGRSVEIPITLSYHGGGVKVAEAPGWVGQGWSLVPGGAITRSVRGKPDEVGGEGYLATGHRLWGADVTYGTSPQALYADIERGDVIDVEPDAFSFNANGRSGTFGLMPDALGGGAVVVPRQPIEITRTNGFFEWTIRDETGLDYVYQPQESTDVQGMQLGATSAWKLAEIRSRLGGGVVASFSYAARNVNHAQGWFQERLLTTGTACMDYAVPARNGYAVSTEQVLTEIETDLERVTFHSTTIVGGPLVLGKREATRLDSVRVFSDAGVLVRRFVFDYQMHGDRLFLEGVQELPPSGQGAAAPPYRFAYDSPDELPGFDSKAIDHWGYFNGLPADANLFPRVVLPDGRVVGDGADRETDPSAVLVGTLTDVTLPTGGALSFTYGPHDYAIATGSGPGETKACYKLPTSLSVEPDASGLYALERETTFQIAATSCDGLGGTLVTFQAVVSGCSGGADCDVLVFDGNGRHFFTASTAKTEHVLLPPGTYTARVSRSDLGRSVRLDAEWESRTETLSGGALPLFAGGARIERVVVYPGGGADSLVTTYDYRLNSLGSPDLSSGMLTTRPSYVTAFDPTNRTNPGVPPPSCTILSVTSSPALALGTTQGGIVGYREVTETRGVSGEGGQIVRFFRSPLDASDQDVGGYHPFGTATNMDWLRGQPMLIEYRDNTGALLKSEAHQYDVIARADGSETVELRGLATKSSNSLWLYKWYRVVSGALKPLETVTTTLD